MAEELAIIKHVVFGVGDRGEPVMTFEARQEFKSALQVLSWEDAGALLKETGFGSISQFEGKPIVVEDNGGSGMAHTLVFKRMANL